MFEYKYATKFVLMKKLTLIILIIIGVSFCINGQNDTNCYAVKVFKKGKTFKKRKFMDNFSKNGFYIYKNYCYSLVFIDDNKALGKIVEILNDTIFITNSLNSASALKRNIVYDTLHYSIKDIKTLQLITDDIDGYTRDINMCDYNLQLIDTKHCCFGPITVELQNTFQIYADSKTILKTKTVIIKNKTLKTKADICVLTDCYPYLTNNGIAYIYEKEGNIYLVHGKPSPAEAEDSAGDGR
jgi:hypothetical protein